MDKDILALIGMIAIWNLIVFFIYGIDKWKAVNNSWRVSERILIVLSFMIGGVGAICGMIAFHHKVSKIKFRALVPIGLIVTLAEIWSLIF